MRAVAPVPERLAKHRNRAPTAILHEAHLTSGQHTTLTLPIPPNAAQLRRTPAAAVTAVGELLDHHTHAQIAGILNDRA